MSSVTNKLKQGIAAYGKMLKNAYIPSHKKKEIRMTKKRMERELARLESETKLENARLRLETTRARLNKVQRVSRPQSGLMKWLSDSPDYLGIQGGGRRGGSRRRSKDPFDLGF